MYIVCIVWVCLCSCSDVPGCQHSNCVIISDRIMPRRGPGKYPPWTLLPHELLAVIFGFLCRRDVLSCALVCRCVYVHNYGYRPLTPSQLSVPTMRGTLCSPTLILSGEPCNLHTFYFQIKVIGQEMYFNSPHYSYQEIIPFLTSIIHSWTSAPQPWDEWRLHPTPRFLPCT